MTDAGGEAGGSSGAVTALDGPQVELAFKWNKKGILIHVDADESVQVRQPQQVPLLEPPPPLSANCRCELTRRASSASWKPPPACRRRG